MCEIRNAGLQAWCDKAEMSFSNNALLRTTLRRQAGALRTAARRRQLD